MNPVAISAHGAARRLLRHRGPAGVRIDDVQTARRYEIVGARDASELDQSASKVLANDCVEEYFIHGIDRADSLREEWPLPPKREQVIRRIPLGTLNDDALAKLSREAHLFLSLDEMRAIQRHFSELKRDPTDLELETLAQTWSEHCDAQERDRVSRRRFRPRRHGYGAFRESA
jgi:phosphoribosylformylglycinamidine synthase